MFELRRNNKPIVTVRSRPIGEQYAARSETGVYISDNRRQAELRALINEVLTLPGARRILKRDFLHQAE